MTLQEKTPDGQFHTINLKHKENQQTNKRGIRHKERDRERERLGGKERESAEGTEGEIWRG